MFKKLFTSQLRLNILSGSATTIVNIIVVAISYPIYLHFLGYEKYGVWLVLATVLTFASLGNLGITTAVTKLVAEKYAIGDILGVQRYITTAIMILLLSGTVILAIMLIFKNPIVSTFRLDATNRQMALWLLPYVGVLCIYSFIIQIFEATLSGLERMDLANYIRTFSHAVQVIIAGILLALGLGVKSMLIGSFTSCAIIHALTVFCIRRIVRLHIWNLGNLDRVYLKRLIQFGGTIFFGSLINMLANPFNKLMLARYAGVHTLPVYEIAFTGSVHLRSLFEAGLRAMVPEISKLGAKFSQARYKIVKIYRHSMNLIFFSATPIYGIILIIAPSLLKIWLGERFVDTLPGVFRLMLFGIYLNLLSVPAYYTLMGLNKVRFCLVSSLITSTINATIVLIMAIWFNSLTVQNIASAVALGLGLSTFYLIKKLHVTLASLSCDAGGNLIPNQTLTDCLPPAKN